jgi:hypothetical protein
LPADYAVDVWEAAQENQPATGLSAADARVDDRAHAGSVDECELAEIEHDQPSLQLRLAERVLQLRCGRHIEVLICVLGGGYTDVQKTMIELQPTDIVQETRSDFQTAMEHKFITLVERLSGRDVVSFISNHHVGPDMEIEPFMLKPSGSETVVPLPA